MAKHGSGPSAPHSNSSPLPAEPSFKDETWETAGRVVARTLNFPSTAWLLIRQAWISPVSEKEFLKLLGFSRLNPLALFAAAELPIPTEKLEVAEAERALQVLGIRFSAVVLAINYSCRAALMSKPPQLWIKIYSDLITDTEIGYKMGLKTFELGGEGGALMGFSRHIGKALLLSNEPKSYRNWQQKTHDGQESDKKCELEFFGCQPYQVAALALQQLGFGSSVSFGMACGAAPYFSDEMNLDSETMRWKAAYVWLEALIAGRNYPADLSLRNYFRELTPQQSGQSPNLTLQSLYVEISKIRQNGSKWIWHLPKWSYEKTVEYLNS